jgi:hypothetical protein
MLEHFIIQKDYRDTFKISLTFAEIVINHESAISKWVTVHPLPVTKGRLGK